MKHLIWAIIWISATVALVFLAWTGWYEVKTVNMPIENKIEQAVQMRSFENHFVQWRSMFLGGAGAGGQGTAVGWAETVDKFLDEVEPGEKIYTAVQLGDGHGLTVEKVYVAGIENRAMLLGYKDIYGMPRFEDGLVWDVVSYSPEEVIFRGANREKLAGLSFFTVLLGCLIGALGHAVMCEKKRGY